MESGERAVGGKREIVVRLGRGEGFVRTPCRPPQQLTAQTRKEGGLEIGDVPAILACVSIPW